jgi:LPXTG-site transpeptidase (sortase) family protein
MPGSISQRLFKAGELLSYAAGVSLTGFFLVQIAQGEVERRSGIEQFEQLASIDFSDPDAAADAPAFEDTTGEPDTTLWAPGRITDYQASLKADLPPIIGILEVPSVGLEVPVYPTDSEMAMDRGAGVIDGMAYPHEPGNIGIAGHRDGYFRVLKDVKVGDTLKLQTFEGPKSFTIDNVQIVEITDTHLLQDTNDQTVTLVTCYPFYFVGHAPQRYIVTASLDTTNVNQQ